MESLTEEFTLCVMKKKDRVLAIGDNLKTDIQGANNLKLESLFITNGVHREELNKTDNLDTLFKKYKVKTDFYQKELTW